MAYSPGYQVPLWLGPAQIRLWRRLDRVIGGRTFAATTVRALAAELGSNPGTISRDLDALARLGFAVHLARWGRAGVTLWRVVGPGGRRGLDPRRARRALARMGVRAAPGQLALISEASPSTDDPPEPSATSPTGPAGRYPAGPVNHDVTAGSSHDGRGISPDPGAEIPPSASGPFETIRCDCGRSRLVMLGREPSPCTHPPTTRSTLGLDP
jgi:hypothetical protein